MLGFRTEGPEEGVEPFVKALRAALGEPRVTFLNYTIDDYEEFFAPDRRAIDPNILMSPFGIQKILVWDSLTRSAWSADSLQLLQLSLQIEEEHEGPKAIARHNCRLELRLRLQGGAQLADGCAGTAAFRGWMDSLVTTTLGPAHPATTDPEWEEKLKRYEAAKMAYAERVSPLLDPACYPPIGWHEGSHVFNIQLCESDAIVDTLRGEVRVRDESGRDVEHYLYDMVSDTFVEEVLLYDGYLGYALYALELGSVQEIRFLFDDGTEILFYEKGDFMKEPLPFKQRYNPEYFRRRREYRRQQRLQDQKFQS